MTRQARRRHTRRASDEPPAPDEIALLCALLVLHTRDLRVNTATFTLGEPAGVVAIATTEAHGLALRRALHEWGEIETHARGRAAVWECSCGYRAIICAGLPPTMCACGSLHLMRFLGYAPPDAPLPSDLTTYDGPVEPMDPTLHHDPARGRTRPSLPLTPRQHEQAA